MESPLEQLRINRVRMRAEEFCQYYLVMKELSVCLLKSYKTRAVMKVDIHIDTVVFERHRECERLECGVKVSTPNRNSVDGIVTRTATFYITIKPRQIR